MTASGFFGVHVTLTDALSSPSFVFVSLKSETLFACMPLSASQVYEVS